MRTITGTVCFALKRFSHSQTKADVNLSKKSWENKSKFTHIAKPAISNAENFIQAVNCENNITKYFQGFL